MSIDQQMDDDARALAELGYTQELHRGMSGFSNFAVSFSIISILAGLHHLVRDRAPLGRPVDAGARAG